MTASIKIFPSLKYFSKNRITHCVKPYSGQSLYSTTICSIFKEDAGISRHDNQSIQRYSSFSNFGRVNNSPFFRNFVPLGRLSEAEYTTDTNCKGYLKNCRVLNFRNKHVDDACKNIPSHLSANHYMYYSTDPGLALKREIERITEQFMEAREMLDDLEESIGTVYFSDDLLEAEVAVKDTIKEYEDLLEKCGEEQRIQATQIMGLKMEELKGHMAMIYDQIKD
ncbi:unnamed protein product [Owenia fusiformis]|uniref:Uncharacterized protein n=1 Tax=Owenia fusiformis TaxID=6347 RepID=A0A8J1XWY4_OWEFU|nr:unnamed protein product [Owenia fusiformis]